MGTYRYSIGTASYAHRHADIDARRYIGKTLLLT